MLQDRQVKLVDGSCVTQEGKKGETIRIHMCYNLTEGVMDDVVVTDKHVAESFALFTMRPDDIYIADAGLGIGKNLQYAVSHQADALLRVTPNHIALSKDARGKHKIDMEERLKTDKDVIDFTCYVHTQNKKYIPARIIASRLPEDKAAQAIKRKKRDAQRKQYVLREKTLVYAKWVILMTTLSQEYSALDPLALYRARWQVELLFKRIKQFFKVQKVKAATLQHSIVIVLLWLLVWAITEREVIAAEILLVAKQADMSLYSSWTMCSLRFNQIKALIIGLLSFCSDLLDDPLSAYRHLRNHKSSRSNHFAQFRFLFSC